MIDAGELGPNSLIWKNGLADWVPAGQVSGLWFATAAGPAASIPAAAFHPTPTTSSPAHPHQPAQISALAVASLVLGLLWLFGIGSLLATIFGAVASSQISRSGGTITGRGLALAGLILGILGLTIAVVLISFGFVEAILDRRPRSRMRHAEITGQVSPRLRSARQDGPADQARRAPGPAAPGRRRLWS